MSDILIVYRNLQAALPGISHVGLGVGALHTIKSLRAAGIPCDVAGIKTVADISALINRNPAITHVVVEAPFLSADALLSLAMSHSRIHICCRVHSQVGFLQVEAGAVRLMRDYIRLQDHTPNFKLAANSPRLASFTDQVYSTRTLVLPNLYSSQHNGRTVHRVPTSSVRIGSFGAIRLMKGHMTAAAAALELASMHRLRLEFLISVNREEHGKGVIDAIRNLFSGVPWASMTEVAWQNWSDFRRTIATLDLHMQMSMSETMNITCADAVSAGVPSVASEAIDWLPPTWVAPIDDASAIARKGWQLISDPHAAEDGRAALNAYNIQSLAAWRSWIA